MVARRHSLRRSSGIWSAVAACTSWFTDKVPPIAGLTTCEIRRSTATAHRWPPVRRSTAAPEVLPPVAQPLGKSGPGLQQQLQRDGFGGAESQQPQQSGRFRIGALKWVNASARGRCHRLRVLVPGYGPAVPSAAAGTRPSRRPGFSGGRGVGGGLFKRQRQPTDCFSHALAARRSGRRWRATKKRAAASRSVRELLPTAHGATARYGW